MGKRKHKPDMTWGGQVCPTEPSHGTLVLLPNGQWHCPHSDHSKTKGAVIKASAYIFNQEQVPQ